MVSEEHLGAVRLLNSHQKDGLRVAMRFSWISPVRVRYITATTCSQCTIVVVRHMATYSLLCCTLGER
jgi:hypothetical protein